MMTRFLPPAASAHAGQIDLVLTLVHWLMAALFAGWAVYFAWVLIRYRRRRQPHADPHGARGRIVFGVEVAVVIAESVLLVAIALPLWRARTSAPPLGPETLVVRVVAEQFAWNIHYPGPDGQFGQTSLALIGPSNPLGLDRTSPAGIDDVIVANQLHLPIDRPVLVQLSSKDVIHSFGVPAMRVKQDAVPGLQTPVWFTPTLAGQFDIACSQLCGLAHYRMRGRVVVESAAAFQQFLAANR